MKKTLVSMSFDFDYIVLGGGSGGIASARRAAKYGAKVALIEKDAYGGTCVNVGCVPKKIMYFASFLKECVEDAKSYGHHLEHHSFDWNFIKMKRDAYVKQLNGSYEKNLKNSGVTELRGNGQLVDSNTILVKDKKYTAKNILIATGGRPKIPEIKGADLGISSDGFFEIEKQPKKVAIVGAGYIAVELAGIFNGLGTETHLFFRKDHFLREFDVLMRDTLTSEMIKAGVHLHPLSIPESVSKNETITLRLENGKEFEGFDVLIWAIGRDPNVENIGLDKAGVKLVNGHIEVDEWQQTSVESIYSVGDVCGRVLLTPVAIKCGRLLSDRLFGGVKDAKMDWSVIASVIFSHPPIGSIGLSEEEATKKYKEIKCYKAEFTPMYYFTNEKKVKTAMKLVCVGKEEKVVGLHIIGMNSDEIVQGFTVGMSMGATKKDFDRALAIHPTIGEELVTMV
jgi:glutathione reductase (NADPH)